MFSATRVFAVLVEPAPDAFVGMDQKKLVFGSVGRQMGWLFCDSRHDVSIGAFRIDAGDAVLGHGCV